MIDNRTTNLDLPLPDLSNQLLEDVLRIKASFEELDARHTFNDLVGNPTTIAGFGITDAYTKAQVDFELGARDSTISSQGSQISGILSADPSQTGNSGEVMTTNGTVKSWTPLKTINGTSLLGTGDVPIMGLGGDTLTGSITLTQLSPSAQTVTPTKPGFYATLPDATTLSEGCVLYSLHNSGDYDYGILDSTGKQLGWVNSKTVAIIGLSSNATAAGIWSISNVAKVGITASFSSPVFSSLNGKSIRQIVIDANRTLILIPATANLYGLVYDNSTLTWGAPTLIRAATLGCFNGVLASTDLVLVTSVDSTTGIDAVTLSLSGTTITVNSGTRATATAGSSVGTTKDLSIISVPAQSAFIIGYLGTSAYLRSITLSVTTPTIGAEVSPGVSTDTLMSLYVSGSIVRSVYLTSATSISVTPYTVSGTTLTVGTGLALVTSGSNRRSFSNGNSNIVVQHINTTHFVSIIKLTGSVEAASSISIGSTPTNLVDASDYLQISGTKFVFLYISGSNVCANIAIDTSGTISKGTEVSTPLMSSLKCMGSQVSGNYANFMAYTTTGEIVRHSLVYDCSGASPVLSKINPLNSSQANVASATNKSGVKSGLLLSAGGSGYQLGNSFAFDLMSTQNSIILTKSLQIPSATPGDTLSLSWGYSLTANNFLGAIYRIEAAE